MLNVTRPQLNETNLDPDVYLQQTSYMEGSNRDNTALLKAWAEHPYDTDDVSQPDQQQSLLKNYIIN